MPEWFPRRFWWLFIVPNILFAGVALATQAADLILILNAAVLAGAVGVCVAYAPAMIDTLTTHRPMDHSDWLGLGIFCSWFGIVVTRLWSLSWRLLGQPMWLANTDIVSYALYLSVAAAAFHMAAPGALDGRSVPTARWIGIGILLAGAVFLSLMGIYLFDDYVGVALADVRAWANPPD